MFPKQALIDLPERLQAMMRQERTSYRCPDYLSAEWQRRVEREAAVSPRAGNPQCSVSSSSSSVINEVWREKICEWSFQVVDHFDFNREIVSVSMSYLDRYLSTRVVNKKIFQLAAMTSLYLAIKLYEPGKLRMASLIDLSRGYFLVEHIASMEDSLLQSLGWHVHPPTPFSFVRDLMLLLPAEISPSLRHDVGELARFLTELSVCDYFFVTKKPSSVALAAIINAVELQGDLRIHPRLKGLFLQCVIDVGMANIHDPEVMLCYDRLREMYVAGGYSPSVSSEEDFTERIATVSPVSVIGTPGMASDAAVCQ